MQGTAQTETQGIQPQYQAGTATGQRFQQMSSGIAGGMYDQTVAPEVKNAVADLDRLANVAEWAKTHVARRGNARAVRICDDLEDLAHVEKQLILRGSPFAEPVGQAVQGTIQTGIQELQQHASEPEIQDSLQQAQQVLTSLQGSISRLRTAGQAMQSQGAQSQQFGQGQEFGHGQQSVQ
jgi:hypothetical protein